MRKAGLVRRAGMLAWLVLSALPVSAAPPVANGFSWYSSVGEASAQALPDNRPLMIVFWADWCGPCQRMEAEVYSTTEFLEASKRILPVKIDFDKKVALARKYSVEALPTIVFTDSYGNELFRYRGYVGARPLLELVKALPGDVTEFNRLNIILAADKDNFGALESMGRSLRAAGLFRASSEYYVRALRRPEAKANSQSREGILNDIGLNFLDVEDPKPAAESFARCLKEFPASPKQAEWTLDLARSYNLEGKKEKAAELLHKLIRENPLSPEASHAQKLLTAF